MMYLLNKRARVSPQVEQLGRRVPHPASCRYRKLGFRYRCNASLLKSQTTSNVVIRDAELLLLVTQPNHQCINACFAQFTARVF